MENLEFEKLVLLDKLRESKNKLPIKSMRDEIDTMLEISNRNIDKVNKLFEMLDKDFPEKK